MHSKNLEWKGRTNNGTDQPDRAFIVTIFDIQHTLKYTRVYNTNWHIIIIINSLHLLEWLSCTKLEKKIWRLPRHFSQKHVQALHEGAFAWLQMYFARGQVHFKLIRIRIRTTACIGRGSIFIPVVIHKEQSIFEYNVFKYNVYCKQHICSKYICTPLI